MNKQQFLAAVRNKLAGVAQSDVERFLEYCGEMIDDRMEDGLTEEQAVEALGTVNEVAAQFLESAPPPEIEQETAPSGRGKKTVFGVRGEVHSINIRDAEYDICIRHAEDGRCRVVCREADKMKHTVSVQNGTLTITRTDTRRWHERLGNWGENTLSITAYLPKKVYQSLYLKTTSGDIEVAPGFQFSDAALLSTSGDISFAGDAEEGLYVQSRSGDVSVKDTTGGYIKTVTTSGDSQLSGLAADKLEMGTGSGDINAVYVTVKQQAEIQTLSGEIHLSEVKADALKANTSSGGLELACVQVAGQAMLETASGDISLVDMIAQALKVKTGSGDVEAHSAVVSGEAEFAAVSGDVHLKYSEADVIWIQTVSGDVEGSFLSPKHFVTHTVSGNVRVPASDASGGSCQVTTTSGDIRIRVTK